jgi:hypothetical protein
MIWARFLLKFDGGAGVAHKSHARIDQGNSGGEWGSSEIPRLVTGNGGVDGAGPFVDAAREGLDVGEVLVAEPHGDGERTLAVVAEDDDGLIGVEFGVGAGGDFAHGHQKRTGEAGKLKLDGLTDVQ